MKFLLMCFAMIWCSLLICEATPWRNVEAHHSQACGDKLADIMSLVCSGRGYNVAFRPQGRSSRRIRRGIVEECCRKSCSPAMLELYCRADPVETTSNVQIRKRSDSGTASTEMHQDGDLTKTSTIEADTYNTLIQENKIKPEETTTSTATKEGKENYKLLNLLVTSEHPTYKQNTKISFNEPIPNDTTEEQFIKQSNVPLMRHHKNHHILRQFRGHKATKTKREKNSSGDSMQTFQIGTVKPYFAGRALVSYRSNNVHHAPLS